MSLKTALINLAGSVGKCQENARSLKQCLEMGLYVAGVSADWTLIGTKTGATKVDIPAGYSEIYIEVALSTNVMISAIIPMATLGETAKRVVNGYFASDSVYAYAGVDVKSTDVIIQNVSTNGSNHTSDAVLTVYAK